MRDLIDPALAKGTPCLVATASKDGSPNIGYKGSVMVFDDDSLAYWERTLQGTQHNVEENPNVMILFRDPATRAAWRFVGKATVHKDRAATRPSDGSNGTGRAGSRPRAQGVCGDRQSR